MHFEKVSYSRFSIDVNELYDKKINTDEAINLMYNKIKLPKRSTEGSAGYDFVIPFSIDIYKGSSIVIPTGIRAVDVPNNVALLLMPRSGLGFRYKVSLANTIGLIDSDYYKAANEGHILVKICYEDFISVTKINDITLMNPETSTLSVSTSRDISPNADKDVLHFNAGDRFCQGLFTYCLFVDEPCDEDTNKRIGGIGSTGNN